MPPGQTAARTFVVDGVSLYVERKGRGSQVLCLTAMGHDAHDFDPLIERLGDRFEFIMVEWPGHGRSAMDAKPASAARYAALLERLAPKLRLDAPIVLGNSIGGAAGLIYASKFPVRALVLCNSGGLAEVTPGLTRACNLFAAFFAAGAQGAWWFGPVFALYYRLVLRKRAAAAQRCKIVANARKMAPLLRDAWTSFGRPEAYLGPLAERLEAPVWVAWAMRDLTPLDWCRPTIAKFRHGRLSGFDAGHTAFLEQPDAFAAEFTAFVDQLPAPLAVAKGRA
jgi:4,5:9,10-diseco-3-hydroxy-5,9,17-trioxoandrosta-1(10),2-diene-4-oate hydrolase